MSNIPAIVETIILHEALYKRKPFLDSFSDGLQVLGVRDMICHFPNIFKPAFVFSGHVTPADVLKILHPKPDESGMDENTKRVWKYVTLFIEAADSDGNIWLVFKYHCDAVYFHTELKAFLQFVTGAPAPVG